MLMKCSLVMTPFCRKCTEGVVCYFMDLFLEFNLEMNLVWDIFLLCFSLDDSFARFESLVTYAQTVFVNSYLFHQPEILILCFSMENY